MEKATDNLNEKPAVTKNFIELAIDKDLAEGKYTEICTHDSHRSRMVICISAMPNPSF